MTNFISKSKKTDCFNKNYCYINRIIETIENPVGRKISLTGFYYDNRLIGGFLKLNLYEFKLCVFGKSVFEPAFWFARNKGQSVRNEIFGKVRAVFRYPLCGDFLFGVRRGGKRFGNVYDFVIVSALSSKTDHLVGFAFYGFFNGITPCRK